MDGGNLILKKTGVYNLSIQSGRWKIFKESLIPPAVLKMCILPSVDFNWIKEMEAEEKYWAFSLALGNKLHFGWLKLKFYLVEEIGFNQIPNQQLPLDKTNKQ